MSSGGLHITTKTQAEDVGFARLCLCRCRSVCDTANASLGQSQVAADIFTPYKGNAMTSAEASRAEVQSVALWYA